MRHFERIPVIYQGEIFKCSGTWNAGEHFIDNLMIFVPGSEIDLHAILFDTVMEDIAILATEYMEESEYDFSDIKEDLKRAPI